MIEFILNNDHIKTDIKTGVSLLSFIRNHRGLKGTKAGCKEGDCGACTVLSGTLGENNTVDYKSIVSCLTPLANAHGKHIVTIEGLNLDKTLNTSQQVIKDNYATQCGFCTPGFVVSLTGLALKGKKPDYYDAIDAFSGNICRCTGYKSIEKAAKDFVVRLDDIDLNKNIDWLIENKFIPGYFKDIPQRLKIIDNDFESRVHDEFIAGGTDIYVRYADKLTDKDISRVADLVPNKIFIKNDICYIGGNTTVADIWHNDIFSKYFSDLKKYLKLISSEQIRNSATIAGNFVNASPIGDMSIFFLALDSSLRLVDLNGEKRKIALKDFFIDYKKIDLKENELIEFIEFELPDNNTFFNFEKVSKRTHLDIASVNTAVFVKTAGNKITKIHISLGGVSAIPKYLNRTSEFLTDKELNKENILKAVEILQSEISPIDDIRGSIKYKRLLAKQLFFAHFMSKMPDIFDEQL